MESVATVETRCKAGALPPRLGSFRLPHFPQPRRRIYLQTINPGGGSFLLDRGGLFLRCQSDAPDRTRLSVGKFDPETRTQDLWVLDIATGEAIRLTSNEPGERAGSSAWSPDGSQIAYTSLRGSYYGLYRQAANGEGEEELLFHGHFQRNLVRATDQWRWRAHPHRSFSH